MLGLGADSKTTINLIRTKQCVLNLVDDTMAGTVNALAMTTGAKEMLTAAEDSGYLYFKRTHGYQYVKDKFGRVASDLVRPPRVDECLECMNGSGSFEVISVFQEMHIRANWRWSFLMVMVAKITNNFIDTVRATL